MQAWGGRALLPSNRVVGRLLIVLVLLVGYWLAFDPLHQVLGSPAFLLGYAICLVAALLLGVPGAMTAIVITVLLDRWSALALQGPDTTRSAGVAALLVKLVVCGGTGLLVDVRRWLGALHARLAEETSRRERADAALKRSEALYRALMECLSEGVGVFDARDRCLLGNEALEKCLRTTHAQLAQKPFSDFVTDQSRHRSPALSTTARRSRRYEIVPRDDDSALLLVTETRVDDVHEPVTLRVVQDLTERVIHERKQRDFERELQRGQALQSLAVLAGGVAHDFNNLLNGVIGNVELARLRLPEAAAGAVGDYLDEIDAFAREAAHLSRQMLAFAGRRGLAIGRVQVNTELANVLRLLHATVESKARLRLELSGDLPEVAADRLQLRQVLTNLVLNALEAMGDRRGTLTLHTSEEEIGSRASQMGIAPGKYVKISVSDTGIGIPAELRAHIFEPFFSTKSGGRGMGLAAAAGIVRTHQGWLGVEDEAGREGTTISVMFPLAQPSTPEHSSAMTQASTSSRPQTVLLIDDEPAVRLVTSRLIRELGHRVLSTDGGASGVQVFREQRGAIDLVLLDLTMPDQSGAEVLGELRRIQSDVRVVISSGFHPADAGELLRSPNVVGFLEKPHALASLERVLASVPSHQPVHAISGMGRQPRDVLN
jgi:two-component system, cell cycle sensor histidine kinase and response regulator CckA